ncbi:MAG: flavin reductase [Oscillospiraceae bacterium]|nr:flavin reductase [Oscillospiraceae bacterium]
MMLKEFNIGELTFNPFERIGNDWCLISAGNESGFNTMTASWGGVGILWGREVATCYIRPQRYTKQFVDGSDYFTLTFFPDGYKKALGLCGRVSGRDHDKPKEAGLTPLFTDGTVTFEEANLILVCRKLYAQKMTEDSFVDKEVLARNYPEMDLHTMYIGEIVKAYKAD